MRARLRWCWLAVLACRPCWRARYEYSAAVCCVAAGVLVLPARAVAARALLLVVVPCSVTYDYTSEIALFRRALRRLSASLAYPFGWMSGRLPCRLVVSTYANDRSVARRAGGILASSLGVQCIIKTAALVLRCFACYILRFRYIRQRSQRIHTFVTRARRAYTYERSALFVRAYALAVVVFRGYRVAQSFAACYRAGLVATYERIRTALRCADIAIGAGWSYQCIK